MDLNKPTYLKPTSIEPFGGGWEDWVSDDDKLVTICTLSNELYDWWFFDKKEDCPIPGVFRGCSECESCGCYTIIIPSTKLYPQICEDWIKILNKTFYKDFELVYDGQSEG